jgi:transposase
MVTAIWYVLRTGCPWRDVPDQFGPWSSVYTRWRRWCESGLWARLLAALARGARGELRHIDCSHIKVHHHGTNPCGGQAQQAIGRSKGGINTKLAAVVDAYGRAVALGLAPGNRHDLKAIQPLVPALRCKRVVGDKGFDAGNFRTQLRRQRTRVCIAWLRCRRQPMPFHRGYYRRRHRVENFFARLKRFRRVATRYDKLAVTYLGFVQFAAILDWLIHEV